MILETIWACDGCRRKLTREQSAEHQERFRHFLEAHPGENLQHVTEIFCPRCGEFAAEYWSLKPQILREAWEVFSNRVENHRQQFFQKRVVASQLKAVK